VALGDKAPQCKNSDKAKNYRESTRGFYSLNKFRQRRGRRLAANFAHVIVHQCRQESLGTAATLPTRKKVSFCVFAPFCAARFSAGTQAGEKWGAAFQRLLTFALKSCSGKPAKKI
jgi:hypothetical protein